jgi:hypothetical protein
MTQHHYSSTLNQNIPNFNQAPNYQKINPTLDLTHNPTHDPQINIVLITTITSPIEILYKQLQSLQQ